MNAEINGIINLIKPSGITSQTAVNRVKRVYGVKKAGHAGTLDPNASGVLPIMLGNGVRLSELLVEHDKCYTAELVTGTATDTGDITGTVTESSDIRPTLGEVREALLCFEGGYDQLPPMYSALKVGGVKLVDSARKGIEIKRVPRHISIYEISAEETDGRIYISVHCSRGTYIRTLCEDIGKKLGVPACMGSLFRTRVGNFNAADGITLEALEALAPESAAELVISPEDALLGLPKHNIPAFFASLIKNGCAVETRKLGLADAAPGTLYRLYDNGSFFAVGEICEADGKSSLRHKKLFV